MKYAMKEFFFFGTFVTISLNHSYLKFS
jgi:hypothetical protein